MKALLAAALTPFILLLSHDCAYANDAWKGAWPESSHFHGRHLGHVQDSMDEYLPALLFKNAILPWHPVIPFDQWNSNNGYCGEVSLIQAGMNQGQWMSQYNARLICGAGLSQAGPDGFCSAHGEPNYNAQVLLENPNVGDAPFANAGLCLQNSRLSYELYDYSKAPAGMAGYQNYLSWIKSQVIAGNQVTIGLLNFGGRDPQYDHEVSVTRIGTNHSVHDPRYFDDDVLFFDEHGSGGGIPYESGYTFKSLANSRAGANAPGAHEYSILIPGEFPIYSAAGGDGIHDNSHPIIASNYGFSVSGPADPARVTLPVRLTIISSTTDGLQNTPDPVDGYNFETPGLSDSCTNAPPRVWMGLRLLVEVSGLIPGTAYNLYEYDFSEITGIGSGAALAVPEINFNASAKMASKITSFIANTRVFSKTIETTSDRIIVFRCVQADSP